MEKSSENWNDVDMDYGATGAALPGPLPGWMQDVYNEIEKKLKAHSPSEEEHMGGGSHKSYYEDLRTSWLKSCLDACREVSAGVSVKMDARIDSLNKLSQKLVRVGYGVSAGGARSDSLGWTDDTIASLKALALGVVSNKIDQIKKIKDKKLKNKDSDNPHVGSSPSDAHSSAQAEPKKVDTPANQKGAHAAAYASSPSASSPSAGDWLASVVTSVGGSVADFATGVFRPGVNKWKAAVVSKEIDVLCKSAESIESMVLAGNLSDAVDFYRESKDEMNKQWKAVQDMVVSADSGKLKLPNGALERLNAASLKLSKSGESMQNEIKKIGGIGAEEKNLEDLKRFSAQMKEMTDWISKIAESIKNFMGNLFRSESKIAPRSPA